MMSLQELCRLGKGTLVEAIGIELLDVGDGFVRGKMPVDHRTVQPFGLLHGGASAAFAETLGSVAGMMKVDSKTEMVVGKSLRCKHIRSVREGWVFGCALPVEINDKTHVWSIKIEDNKGELVCSCRLALEVVSINHRNGS